MSGESTVRVDENVNDEIRVNVSARVGDRGGRCVNVVRGSETMKTVVPVWEGGRIGWRDGVDEFISVVNVFGEGLLSREARVLLVGCIAKGGDELGCVNIERAGVVDDHCGSRWRK